MNIAITAAGGGVGQSIIKALKNSDYNIIALDGEPLGAGLYMTDRRHLVPYANSDEYIPTLLGICKREKVDLLFPGMDIELKKLSECRQMFKEIGTKVIVSNPDVIEIADDKLLTNEFLYNNHHPTANTANKIYDIPFPFIMKPKKGGARSKNVYKIEKAEDIPAVDLENYVYQEYIEGDEYTCGTVTLADYKGCIVMRRILRDGDTYKAFVEHNKAIEELCEAVCKELKPFGAFNIQLRLRNGIPYVFEFNARCSGTTGARALAGFNEPLMIADYFLKGKPAEFRIRDITILRYWNELVVKNEDIINR